MAEETTPASSQGGQGGPADGDRAARAGQRLPPSRQGKKAVTAYVDPDTHKQLRMLGLELGKSSQDIIIEALADYFERQGIEPKERPG